MIPIKQIIILSIPVLLLTGCAVEKETEPVWRQVKLADLASPKQAEKSTNQVRFDIYTFEVPLDKIAVLDEIHQNLDKEHIQFSNAETFKANYFSVGFGQMQVWDKIAKLLNNCGAKKTEISSLIVFENQFNDFTVKKLNDKQNIFYTSKDYSTEGLSIGPGNLGLRIKTEKIPAIRGACNVYILPIYSSLAKKSPLSRLESLEAPDEYIFRSLSFNLVMGPGDFLFLSPARYISTTATLGGAFFNSPIQKPVVRVFLLLCAYIKE